MRFDSFTAFLAVSDVLCVAAGPLVAKRQDESSLTASATSSRPTAALIPTTNSNGEETTIEVFAPEPTKTDASESASVTGDASVTAASSEKPSETTTSTRTGQPASSTSFPQCDDPKADPFCLPSNLTTWYIDKTYFATWNPDNFVANSTVIVKVQYSNDSSQEVWSSGEIDNGWGFVAIPTTKDFLKSYSMFNVTLSLLNFGGDSSSNKAVSKDGPLVMMKNEPPRHLPPSEKNKGPNKEGLIIGLPVGLGFVLLVVVGLFFGMRKHRTIGLGNIMGRRNRGYGVGKSRRQRLGLGSKKGAIRLEEREQSQGVRTAPTHTRGDSLGSLVSDDGIRPAPGGNHFRDEIRRQQTGR